MTTSFFKGLLGRPVVAWASVNYSAVVVVVLGFTFHHCHHCPLVVCNEKASSNFYQALAGLKGVHVVWDTHHSKLTD